MWTAANRARKAVGLGAPQTSFVRRATPRRLQRHFWRLDNVGIVVDNLAAAIDFFGELGLELEGRAMIEGEWAGRITGLGDQRVDCHDART